MQNRTRVVWAVGLLALAVGSAGAQADHNSIVITFKNGQQQGFPAAAVARLELKVPAQIVFRDGHQESLSPDIASIEFKTSASTPGENHFLGKWKCGDGAGGSFIITLRRDGVARKSIGAVSGTWTVVDGEARIKWDDGWKDILRRAGGKHEKIAFSPGKSFSDEPSNVTTARIEDAEPI
jgi:hypothetical protein